MALAAWLTAVRVCASFFMQTNVPLGQVTRTSQMIRAT